MRGLHKCGFSWGKQQASCSQSQLPFSSVFISTGTERMWGKGCCGPALNLTPYGQDHSHEAEKRLLLLGAKRTE